MKCFVDPCPNCSDQGTFVNYCCKPCYDYTMRIARARAVNEMIGTTNVVIQERINWIEANLVNTIQHCILERYDETKIMYKVI